MYQRYAPRNTQSSRLDSDTKGGRAVQKRFFLLLTTILTMGVLAACGGAASQTPSGGAAATTGAATTEATVEAATGAPTEAVTEAATEAPTEEATPEPTAEATEEAAEETTAAATAEATAEATANAAETTTAAGNVRTFEIVPDQSEATYDVQEQFLGQDLPVRAVGRTSAVSGTFEFSTDGQPTGQVTQITVDLRTLTTDSDRRDNAIRENWLQSNTYPFATFTSTEVQNIPESYTDGEEITFQLVGDMTVRDVTSSVTFTVTGKLEGDTVTGTATAPIKMTDFGFDPPNIAGFVTVEDDVNITINFTARETQ
jgi:polyisoprenoid-binding protein YceI